MEDSPPPQISPEEEARILAEPIAKHITDTSHIDRQAVARALEHDLPKRESTAELKRRHILHEGNAVLQAQSDDLKKAQLKNTVEHLLAQHTQTDPDELRRKGIIHE
eukprot:gnl/Trimastix_PCT/219.p2 GENE.gnl/Trimastix_PCT/219~~gnl/Trimastix_PCT/219.p2  ORF type:complete len:107 (+),score=29.90 gnl/Trimastix_PCT/219:62-382(+)